MVFFMYFVVEWVHRMFGRTGDVRSLSGAFVPRRNNFLTRPVNMLFRGWNYTVTAERSSRLVTCSCFSYFNLSSDFCHFRSYSIKSLSTHNPNLR